MVSGQKAEDGNSDAGSGQTTEEEAGAAENDGNKMEKPKEDGEEASADTGMEESPVKGASGSVSDNDTGQTEEENGEKDTVSGNDMEAEDETGEKGIGETEEIIDVVVPADYTLALNPYCLPIGTEEGITTEQIISGTYGIVNKSSTDQIVTVSLTVEDSNEGELVFMDSAEEVEKAGMHVYAIYLSAVPANEAQILIDGKAANERVTGEALQKARMTGDAGHAVALHEGTNEIIFKLSKAVYDIEIPVLKELAPNGKGVTAYTLSGVMNPDAEWEKLSGGIRLSVVYTYETAYGNEEIVEGTGAMISAE